MKIVSTTLAGPHADLDRLATALASVEPYVDEVILVWTDNFIPTDLVRNFFSSSVNAKLVLELWPWQDDFGAARQAALEFATAQKADWCVWVDSDEWIVTHDEQIRLTIAAQPPDVHAILMYDASNCYQQPRALRLPYPAKWEGRVHEALTTLPGTPSFISAKFSSYGKTEEEYRAKFVRDIRILREVIAKDPLVPRWHFYLANSIFDLASLDRPYGMAMSMFEEAVHIWKQRLVMGGWAEEAAFAAYRAASCCLFQLERPGEALKLCCAGMTAHAGLAELPWTAAIACQRLGQHEQAIYWAQTARVHGEASKAKLRAVDHRTLFRIPKALTNGPADVERFSYEALGMPEAAALAEAEFQGG